MLIAKDVGSAYRCHVNIQEWSSLSAARGSTDQASARAETLQHDRIKVVALRLFLSLLLEY